MNRKQEAKLGMYNAVSTFCADNAAITGTVLAFQTAVTDFDNAIAELRNAAQKEAHVILGITRDKTNLKNDLCDTAAGIASAVFAYAVSINSEELKEQANFPVSKLQYLRDELLAGTCRNIWGVANTSLAALADYGITAPKLADFLTKTESYENAVPEPRNAVSIRAAQSTTITEKIRHIDAILKNRMDKLVVQFKTTHNEFYKSYRNNRIIIDAGSSATQLVGSVKQQGTDIAISGAVILVVEKEVTGISNALGAYVVPVTTAGYYKVKFTAEGYEEKEVTAVNIALGKTTTLNVELSLLPR